MAKEKKKRTYNGKEGEILFNVYIDKELKEAITYAAWYHRMSIKGFLNNFFKDFLAFQGENSHDPEYEAKIKELLKNVKYDTPNII